MGASKKRCWRCSSVIEIKTLMLSDLLSESTSRLTDLTRGVEHSATWRSILFGYCHICPFKERIYESFVPFLPHTGHSFSTFTSFPAWECVSKAASHLHLLLGLICHVTYNPPDTSCPLLLVLVHLLNLLICKIQGIFTEWLSSWGMSWCSNNVCQFRPTSLYVFMNWMVCQAQASRQMNYLPSILHLCLIV